MQNILRKSNEDEAGARLEFPEFSHRALSIIVVVVAVGLQLADTGLDLSEVISSGDAKSSAAGVVGVFELIFGFVAALVVREL